MAGSNPGNFDEILTIDAVDARGMAFIASEKLRIILPDEIIELIQQHESEAGFTRIDVNGFQFGPDGKRKSVYPIARIFAIDRLSQEILEEVYIEADKQNSADNSGLHPTTFGSDLKRVSTFIICETCDCSIVDLGTKMAALNAEYSSDFWPDAVGVVRAGVVSFSAVVLGHDDAGQFFLPTKRAQNGASGAPSVTVQLVARASDNQSFAKIVSLIVARCAISLRDVRIPDFRSMALGYPRHGVAVASYQFNLMGQLKPQIFEQSLANQFPGNRFLVEAGEKELGSFRFLPWQDGAIVAASGLVPLEILLSFLKELVPGLTTDQLQFFRQGKTQLSHVLPISIDDFIGALRMFDQRSSNMRVRWDDKKQLITQISDEGTSSVFVARLRYGVLTLREAVFLDEEALKRFDRLYDNVYSNLQSVREARDAIVDAWDKHIRKLEEGEIVIQETGVVRITESIDRVVRRETESLWNAAVRVLKQCSQSFLRENKVETDFLFKKQSTFDQRISLLRKTDSELADYFLETRKWTEVLILLRNEKLEHGEPLDLKIQYDIESTPLTAVLPKVTGKTIVEHAEYILDRCCVYVEEMTVYCIMKKLPPSLTISEIPLTERDESVAVRFSITVSPGGAPQWVVVYSAEKFENL